MKLNSTIEEKIQKHLAEVVRLLKKLDRDDWASDIDATAYAIKKDCEDDREFKRKYGYLPDEYQPKSSESKTCPEQDPCKNLCGAQCHIECEEKYYYEQKLGNRPANQTYEEYYRIKGIIV